MVQFGHCAIGGLVELTAHDQIVPSDCKSTHVAIMHSAIQTAVRESRPGVVCGVEHGNVVQSAHAADGSIGKVTAHVQVRPICRECKDIAVQTIIRESEPCAAVEVKSGNVVQVGHIPVHSSTKLAAHVQVTPDESEGTRCAIQAVVREREPCAAAAEVESENVVHSGRSYP